jgi:hypothetical protein
MYSFLGFAISVMAGAVCFVSLLALDWASRIELSNRLPGGLWGALD